MLAARNSSVCVSVSVCLYHPAPRPSCGQVPRGQGPPPTAASSTGHGHPQQDLCIRQGHSVLLRGQAGLSQLQCLPWMSARSP